jgi:Flp pilus assembly protein TadG
MIRVKNRLHGPRGHERGQALVEFAMIAGLFLFVIGAIIQFGIILWSQNAVTEIARDTARWAVTESGSPCDSPARRGDVAAAADELAQRARLVGYGAGAWTSAVPLISMADEGVGVDWTVPTGFASDCPPSDNGLAVFVTVRVSHAVPIFIPGLQLVAPTCGSAGFCVSSSTELRMEPKSPDA